MQCVRPDGHIAIRFETTVNSAGETGREARMPGLTVALYHAIVPSESSFERGLGIATRPEVFEAQIAHLAKNYDVVDLDTVLSGKLPRRPLLITFDDFYASVLTFAKSVLKPRGLPSVFFVNPDIVGRDAIGLDNVIAFCVNRFGIKAVCEAANLGSQSISSGCRRFQREKFRHRCRGLGRVRHARYRNRKSHCNTRALRRVEAN
jgi:hypothetical protein